MSLGTRFGRSVSTIGDLALRLDARLVAPCTASAVVRLQLFLVGVIGLRLATRDWTLIAERPAELTADAWLLGWLPGPFPSGVIAAIHVAGLVGVGLVLTRALPRAGYVLAWSCYALLAGLWGASGKFLHNDILTITVGFILLFASVPGRPVRGQRAVAWGWPLRATLAVVGTVYFLTGAQKLRHSGLAWVFSDNMAWTLRQRPSHLSEELTRFAADTPALGQLLAGGALLLEISAPVLLFFAATRVWFALGVTAMHTSIWAFLGLDYSAWILTVWAVVLASVLASDRDLRESRGDFFPCRSDRLWYQFDSTARGRYRRRWTPDGTRSTDGDRQTRSGRGSHR